MFKLTFPTSIIELLVLLSLSRAALGCSSSGSKGNMSIMDEICYEIP